MPHDDPTSLAADPAVAPLTRVERVQAVIEQQIDMMTRLAGIGLDVAEAFGRRAVAQAAAQSAEPAEGGAPRDNQGVADARIARSVRLTLALQARFVKDLLNLDKIEAQDRPAQDRAAAAEAEPDPLEARRERIARIAIRVIEADEDDEDEVERLSGDVWERLTDEDIYDDVLSRPIGEMVARICEDLELSPDWASLAKEAWAVAEAASGVAGSPFVKSQPQARSP